MQGWSSGELCLLMTKIASVKKKKDLPFVSGCLHTLAGGDWKALAVSHGWFGFLAGPSRAPGASGLCFLGLGGRRGSHYRRSYGLVVAGATGHLE